MDLVKYDQHLMVDLELLDRIASKCSYKEVIEIGPGDGALTQKLLKKAKVTAYEIDPKKVELLNKKFSNEIKNNKLTIINSNILDEKITGDVIFSNLPYSISEPLFYKLVKSNVKHIFLITGENFYKLLTSAEKIGFFRKIFYKIDFFEKVSKSAFDPMPRVNSCFYVLHKKENDDFWSIFLSQHDKKLKNALIEGLCVFQEISKNDAKKKIEEFGLSYDILNKRIIHLSNAQFNDLTNLINSKL